MDHDIQNRRGIRSREKRHAETIHQRFMTEVWNPSMHPFVIQLILSQGSGKLQPVPADTGLHPGLVTSQSQG